MLPWDKALNPDRLLECGRSLPASPKIAKFSENLLAWYATNGRRFPWRNSSLSTYKVIVTELLLQRTRAETVSSFLPRFLDEYPDWQALAGADRSTIEKSLEPIGLQKRRASTLHRLAQAIVASSGRVPGAATKLFALPGIGQYVFYAVNLYRRNDPLPLLDSGMARLLERYFGKDRLLVDIRYDPYLQQLARAVVASADHKKINWAMLDVVSAFCVPREPRCDGCPLRETCMFASQ